ncbi:hypothetical protein D3C81_1893320 [compost metagenome]
MSPMLPISMQGDLGSIGCPLIAHENHKGEMTFGDTVRNDSFCLMAGHASMTLRRN